MAFIRPGATPAPGFALQFPTNVSGADTAASYVAIKFVNPQSNGLPIWGASNGGITVVRKIKVAQQTGYHAMFWWSNDGAFLWNAGAPGSYWGMHPYPQNAANTGTTHWWEIATGGGDDFGPVVTVTKDINYLQGMTVTRAGASDKTLKFYFNLPNTNSSNYINRNELAANFGESNPPSPAVTIGDSPWYASYQHERFGGTLDAIKIFTPALSEADMLSESADFSRIVTAAGATNIWWGKNGFLNIDDLTCNYGTARAFVWADTSNKGTLVARL